MPNPIEARLKDRIQSFVTELDLLVRKSALEALRGVLTGDAAPGRRGRPRGRPAASASVEGAAESILSFVRSNDGQGVREIAAGTGVQLKAAKKVVGQLLASGQLKKSGRRRGTRYHVGSGRKPRAVKRGKRRGKKAKAA